MAGQRLRTELLPAGLDRLLARAEGVPFLVEELLAAAVDGGGLVREGGRWVMRPGGETVVPQTLSASIAQRMDALDRAGREIAQAAALVRPAVRPGAGGGCGGAARRRGARRAAPLRRPAAGVG